jgi:inhibitor of KinA sporulation pathway (predicted exonuclease)
MANTVYETTEIELIDGTKVKMRPLKISLLRKFMKTFEDISQVQADNDKSMDVLIDCVQIAMEQYSPELAQDREKLEENLDLPSVYKVIEAAAGIKFDEQGNVPATGVPGLN